MRVSDKPSPADLMPTLVILVPARARAQAAGQRHERGADEFAFVLTRDGTHVHRSGTATAALLPRADTVVAVLGDHDLSWHRVTLPKAPASKMRAALLGLMEEQLLDETEAVHLAIEPQHVAGQEAWVCAVDKPWLQNVLDTLQQVGSDVDRVVPMSWPDLNPSGHFSENLRAGSTGSRGQDLQLTWSDSTGVAVLPLASQWATAPARWSAHPSVAAQAERWLAHSVSLVADDQRALQAMRSLWNLRQFDLAQRHRGTLALRDAWRRFWSPAWRPARLGLAGFALINVLGLNLWAWHLRHSLDAKRAAVVKVFRDTYPQIKVVQDAPLQMQRETDALRAASGRVGEQDLEAVLSALAAVWPEGRAPLENIRYEGGRLSTSAQGWNDAQLAQLRQALRAHGWQVDQQSGALSLSRAPRS
jgi:general secretion pathway protein L